jgi:hypothetical protein
MMNETTSTTETSQMETEMKIFREQELEEMNKEIEQKKKLRNYKLSNIDNMIIRLPDMAWIPADVSNADYVEYLAWKSEGHDPLPADPDPVLSKYSHEVISILGTIAIVLSIDIDEVLKIYDDVARAASEHSNLQSEKYDTKSSGRSSVAAKHSSTKHTSKKKSYRK